MSFNKYYQDELSFLREMGREFAQAHPEAAHFLSEGESDPDVERLLEGFAFLTGRIRQKLDDEFPELTHSLMNLLFPHYLRPIPPISLIEFSPVGGMLRQSTRIPKGTEVASVPVDGTTCRFRTCFDVDLHPLNIESAFLQTPVGSRTELTVSLKMESGFSIADSATGEIRLFLVGESGKLLYYHLCRHVEKIRLRPIVAGKPADDLFLEPGSVQPGGFTREESLLPYPNTSFDGYRLLQEYFSFPEKFLFVDLVDLEHVRHRINSDRLEIGFIFSHGFNGSAKVSEENIRLFCTPVVNLFQTESEPILINHERTEYRVRPAGGNPQHFEIYSVDNAIGWIQGTSEKREYPPFHSFRSMPSASSNGKIFYETRIRTAVAGDGTDIYVSFVNKEQLSAIPPTETVTFDLTCTNRILAEKLRSGDIRIATDSSPTYARFQNITRVTRGIRPPLGGDLLWRLLSHLALNSTSLSSVPAFRGILELYNFHSLENQQSARVNQLHLESIVDIESASEDLLYKGVPIRGITTRLRLKESHFDNDGDMFLFASILNEFLALYVSLNSFSRLIVNGVEKGETFEWPTRIGHRIVL
ncbi:MAG: type VI secretion system baseplate subunit TssF [Acidobacteria bacterium]|nr:type VI secretion system baseplate subunit TssF [Acidobacteriota bacterium]